jgi:seryl-tRNA synthetase
MDIEVLRDWMADARRSLEKEADRLREKEQQANDLMRCLETTDELVSEVSRLRDQLEKKQSENDDLCRELDAKQREIDNLRMQFVEVKEQRLAESQNVVQESRPLSTEIHNHFESGSSAQVFNSKVTNKIKDKKRWKRNYKKNV